MWHCTICEQKVLGVFFHRLDTWGAQHINWGGGDLVCAGCQLQCYLEAEEDHLKMGKKGLLQTWLKEGDEWNENDLQKAISDFEPKHIAGWAAVMDRSNRRSGWDREYDERQRPVPARNLKKRGDHGRKAFTVEDKTIFEKAVKAAGGDTSAINWDEFSPLRYNGHGYAL